MSKILGLDISSASTGYCIFNNGRLSKRSLGTINPNPKACYGDRLTHFATGLQELLEKYKPDIVIIEDIFRGPNIITFKTLAMWRGLCFFIVYSALGKDPISIMPTAARKLVKVKGITKEDGFNFVIKKYKLDEYKFDTHNDITDAIVLGLAGYEMEKQGISEADLKKKKKRRKKRKKKTK